MPVEQEPKSASDPAPAPPPLLGEAISESCCSRFALSHERQVGVSPGITPAGNAEGALPLISEGLATAQEGGQHIWDATARKSG
jgi:hypothetical protein